MSKIPTNIYTACGATISECGRYRYNLTRAWVSLADLRRARLMVICGANPSTADGAIDDPTIRREVAFAKREGYDGLLKINVGAFRATDPKDCPGGHETFGPANAYYLKMAALQADQIVCAWGKVADPECVEAALQVFCEVGTPLVCFGTNQDGSPKHPLYLAATTPLVSWKPVHPGMSYAPEMKPIHVRVANLDGIAKGHIDV